MELWIRSQDKEIEELLNMLKKCAREDKATLKLNEIACKTILSYIEQLEKDKQILIRNNTIGNERLKELQNINKQLENNRDKAVREIMHMIEEGNITFFKGKKLLNILKGDSDV